MGLSKKKSGTTKNTKLFRQGSFLILILLMLVAVACSLLLGARHLHFKDLLFNSDSFSRLIFTQIRLPRMLLALLAGSLLAGAGAAFQMFFRNPLAEPGIMGVSSGATLGAVIASSFVSAAFRETTLGAVLSPVNGGAFLGALAAGLLVTGIAGRKNGSTVALLLCGTALGSLYSACIAIILSLNDTQLHTMYIWMLGSFSGRGWNEVSFILLPSIVSVVLLMYCARELDLLAGGEVSALSLGVNVQRLRLLVIVSGALASSAAVCAGGTIGFVGLVAPHIMRRIFGSRARKLIPLSMAGGAVLMLFSDTLCRVIMPPSEIPVGTITSLIGAPFFISLLFTKRHFGEKH